MRVHLHGNCQVFVLAAMLREVRPDWTITYFEVHANPIIEQNDAYQEAIRTSDIILSQPIHAGYRGRKDLTLAWIKEAARPSARIVVIPAMHFDGHHIGFCGLASLGDLCSNAVAAQLVAAGVPADRALDMMLSPTLYTEAFVLSEITLSLAEMVRREKDDEIEVKFSSFREHFARAQQAFHVVNHPARAPYAYILNQVLDQLDIQSPKVPFEGEDYQAIPHIPMCPSVALHCQNLFPIPTGPAVANDGCVRLHGQPAMGQRDYFSKMLLQISNRPTDEIIAAIRSVWQAEALLKRLAISDPEFPGISVWAT